MTQYNFSNTKYKFNKDFFLAEYCEIFKIYIPYFLTLLICGMII